MWLAEFGGILIENGLRVYKNAPISLKLVQMITSYHQYVLQCFTIFKHFTIKYNL